MKEVHGRQLKMIPVMLVRTEMPEIEDSNMLFGMCPAW